MWILIGMWRTILVVVLVIAVPVYFIYSSGPIHHPPGVLIGHAPLQEPLEGAEAFKINDTTIRPLANYTIDGRVLATHHDSDSVVPYDVVLGWQSMSDSAVLDKLHLGRVWRYYQFNWDGTPPLYNEDIISMSSTSHIIPSNETVRKKLASLREGDLVRIEGSLVLLTRKDGIHWQSSLSRSDIGNYGSELVFAKAVIPYRAPAQP